MGGFIAGESRSQVTLFPEVVDEYIEPDKPVRVIDACVDDLNSGIYIDCRRLQQKAVITQPRSSGYTDFK